MAKWQKVVYAGISMWLWEQFAIAQIPGAPKTKRFGLWVKYRGEPHPTKIEVYETLAEAKRLTEAAYLTARIQKGDLSYWNRSQAIKEGLERAEAERQEALRILEAWEKMSEAQRDESTEPH
jgi:hypothetical protein